MRGLISSMGFSQIGFEYDRRARVAGKSKFPFKAMLGLAVDGVLNHSLVPLRIASAVGLLVGSFTFVLMFVFLAGRLIFEIGRHTSELQSLMRISYAVFFLKTKNGNLAIASRLRADTFIVYI